VLASRRLLSGSQETGSPGMKCQRMHKNKSYGDEQTSYYMKKNIHEWQNGEGEKASAPGASK